MRKTIISKICVAFVLLHVLNHESYGQAINLLDYHSNFKSTASPNAASLGVYGETPVNLYTGTPNISIPVTTIKNGSVEVPIQLGYNGTAIQVSDQGTWAGLGWNLVCGGQITRKTNYYQDEYNNQDPVFNFAGVVEKGYFFTSSGMNIPDWASTINMSYKLNDIFSLRKTAPGNSLTLDWEPDEFQFNFGKYSGSFYRNEKGEWKVKSKDNLGLEITHEMVTGNASINYKLADIWAPNYDPNNTSVGERVSSLFTKFTITTPDGYKYVFGGDRSAIEFSRTQTKPSSGQIGGPFDPAAVKSNKITANAWNLTSITAPNGETIVLKYKRGRPIFSKVRTFVPAYMSNGGWSSVVANMKLYAVDPSYLDSIETPFQVVNFYSSKARELKMYPEKQYIYDNEYSQIGGDILWNETICYNWGDYSSSEFSRELDEPRTILPRFNQQLDSIKVFDKQANAFVKGFRLFHSADTSRRRTLDSFAVFEHGKLPGEDKYRFTYNHVELLPRYESLRRDHFGNFNGGLEPPKNLGEFPNREPGEGVWYGMLTKIQYPTGGTSEFDFEQGTYSNYVKIDPNQNPQVQLQALEGVGGLRIRKITNKAGYNSPDVVTEYFYKNNYIGGGTSSSGILATSPRYVDAFSYSTPSGGNGCGNNTLANKSDDNSESFGQIHGGLITYSEVTVKKNDGSVTVYKYSSHDQAQYRDEYALNYVAPDGTSNWAGNEDFTFTQNSNYRISSNDLERGNILLQQDYNATGLKVKETAFEYNNDPLRKNEFIKAIAHKELYAADNIVCFGVKISTLPRAWAYKVYCYNNPLSKVTETTYESSGPVVQTKTFEYDKYGNTTNTTTYGSDGNMTTISTKFNSHTDYLGTATTGEALYLKNLFTNYSIKNYPVEMLTLTAPQPLGGGGTQLGADKITKGSVFIYDQINPRARKVYSLELDQPFAPVTYVGLQPTYNFTYSKTASGTFAYDSRYKLQTTINSFSNTPAGTTLQPISITDKTDGNEIITWDYLGRYRTSSTQNATTRDVACSSFEGTYLTTTALDDNRGNWIFTPSMLESNGFTGSRSFLLSSNNLVTRYNLPNGKKFNLNFWLKGNAPRIMLGSTIQPVGYAPVKVAGDWQYYSIPITGTGAQLSILSGTGSSFATQIDEVRMFPIESIMKSYNYDPATGNVLTASDEKGNVTFYKYDYLGRLVSITDEKGNIINNYTYQIQGAQ